MLIAVNYVHTISYIYYYCKTCALITTTLVYNNNLHYIVRAQITVFLIMIIFVLLLTVQFCNNTGSGS